ncbi:MAG: hypothetical protein PF439_01560 [Helicobacteraceae bacterium]|nr:hypothetical protein [Helicobacteraceae bacterium]
MQKRKAIALFSSDLGPTLIIKLIIDQDGWYSGSALPLKMPQRRIKRSATPAGITYRSGKLLSLITESA